MPRQRLQFWIGGQLDLAPCQSAEVAPFLTAINNIALVPEGLVNGDGPCPAGRVGAP